MINKSYLPWEWPPKSKVVNLIFPIESSSDAEIKKKIINNKRETKPIMQQSNTFKTYVLFCVLKYVNLNFHVVKLMKMFFISEINGVVHTMFYGLPKYIILNISFSVELI